MDLMDFAIALFYGYACLIVGIAGGAWLTHSGWL